MKQDKVRRALDNLLSYANVKKVSDDFAKSFEQMRPDQVQIQYDKEKNEFKVGSSIDVNDIIEVEENGQIIKAVVSATGKHGVTARDKDQRQLKVFYRNIIKHKKRG